MDKDLDRLRLEIDAVDEKLVALFSRRMEICAEVAEAKQASGKNVFDPERERKKLAAIAEISGEKMRDYTTGLYSLIFDLSKAYQNKIIGGDKPLAKRMAEAIDNTAKVFPTYATVACQGVEGAYSQIACEKLFSVPNIMYFKNFDAVFSAIEQGFCQYGVLPIENSTAGSVNQVYDLMMRHNFNIVRAVRVKVDHSLIGVKGAEIKDIKEIVSHEQAINQCGEFLKSMGDIKVTVCENTAAAAKLVAESGRKDLAALCSNDCAKLYSLVTLKEAVQDEGSNFTRFICISKNLEIYPGADKTSIMAVTAHKPGALYKLLSRFYSRGINLTKLESRPLPNKNFEFMFYFDLEKSVYSPELLELMDELNEMCESFEYLGSYTEVI